MDFDIENEKVQIEKDGKVIECDVLFTFDSEETMKCYIGYTDHILLLYNILYLLSSHFKR